MLNALIVEDNAAYRQSLHELLARQFPSMQIAEAADGEEALRQALPRHFDLIFMDIRLPHGNGLHLTRNIKATWIDTVICIITSYDIDEYRNAAFEYGADHFLVKGDSTEAEILGMVDSLLHSRFISLIITDDVQSRARLDSLLALHWPKMIVVEVDNPADGLIHILSLKPDLVLLQLGLPGVDVTELSQLIRNLSKRSVLIGLTADGRQDIRDSALGAGVDYCVSLAPSGRPWLVNLVNALQPKPSQH